jgi:hypothetical protein
MEHKETESAALPELEAMFEASELNLGLFEFYARIRDVGGHATEAMFEKLQRAGDEIESRQHRPAMIRNTPDQSNPGRDISRRHNPSANLNLASDVSRESSVQITFGTADHERTGFFTMASFKEHVTHGAHIIVTAIDVWCHFNRANESKKQGSIETDKKTWEHYWNNANRGAEFLMSLVPFAGGLKGLWK